MGEVLHEVDFDQLKIENSQFLELIDGKNKELLRLKLTTGKVLQALNSLRVWSFILQITHTYSSDDLASCSRNLTCYELKSKAVMIWWHAR